MTTQNRDITHPDNTQSIPPTDTAGAYYIPPEELNTQGVAQGQSTSTATETALEHMEAEQEILSYWEDSGIFSDEDVPQECNEVLEEYENISTPPSFEIDTDLWELV